MRSVNVKKLAREGEKKFPANLLCYHHITHSSCDILVLHFHSTLMINNASIKFLSQETYPHTPPVWFAESEETNISNAIQLLSNTSGLDNHVINQVSRYFDSFFISLTSLEPGQCIASSYSHIWLCLPSSCLFIYSWFSSSSAFRLISFTTMRRFCCYRSTHIRLGYY